MDIDITSYLLGKSQGGGGGGTGVKLTVNPSTTDTTYTPEAGTYYNEVEALGVTSSIDANITASNIKNGVSILGVTGNLVVQDWSLIGYSEEPAVIKKGYDYAIEFKNNWTPVNDLTNACKGNMQLIYLPLITLYPNGATNVMAMDTFQGCGSLQEIPLLDTSAISSSYQMFQSCSSLVTVPLLNVSNVTTAYGMFQFCYALETIPAFNFARATNMNYVFSGCKSLKNVPVISVPSALGMEKMFENCENLTNESLNNILSICINSGITASGRKNLKYIGLTSTQATTCQSLSNWDDFVTAGWSTGY